MLPILAHSRAHSFTLSKFRFPEGVFRWETGLVRFLHPAVLSENGAVTIADRFACAIGSHYFAMVVHSGEVALLVPAFSRGGDGRIAVPRHMRSGYHTWADHPCFIHAGQLWLAPAAAVDAAARASGDRSRPEYPNRIDATWLRRALGRVNCSTMEAQ